MSNWSSYPEQQQLHENLREWFGKSRFNRMGERSSFNKALNNVKGSRALSDYKRFYKEALEALETIGEISHRDVTDYEQRLENIIATYERYKDDHGVLETYFGDGRTNFGSQLDNLFTLTQESSFIKQKLFNLLQDAFPSGGGRGGRGRGGKAPSVIKAIVKKIDTHYGLDLDKNDKKKLMRAIKKDLAVLRRGATFGALTLQEAGPPPPPPDPFPKTRAELETHGLNPAELDRIIDALKNKFSSLISPSTGTSSTGTSSTGTSSTGTSSTGTSSTGTSSTGTSSTGTSPPPPGSLTATIDDLSTFIGRVERGLGLITAFRRDRTLENLRSLVSFFEALSTPPTPPPVTEEKTKGKPKPNSVKIEEFLDEMKKQIKSFIKTFKDPNEEELNGEEINNFLDFFEVSIKNGKEVVENNKKASGADSSAAKKQQDKEEKATAKGAEKNPEQKVSNGNNNEYFGNTALASFLKKATSGNQIINSFYNNPDNSGLEQVKEYFKQLNILSENYQPDQIIAHFADAINKINVFLEKKTINDVSVIKEILNAWRHMVTNASRGLTQPYKRAYEELVNFIKSNNNKPQNQQKNPEDNGTKGAQPAVANNPQQMDKLAANAGPNNGRQVQKENLQEQQLKVKWKLLAGIK